MDERQTIPDSDYLPILQPQNQNYLVQDQLNKYPHDDIQVLKSRGLHISDIQDIQGGSNFESLFDQGLNDKQFSNLVMVLEKQQQNKEKFNRNIDLNKINYLQHINNKSDIYINSAQYNSFLQSINFRPSYEGNIQKKASLQQNKINQIYNTEANSNRLKKIQLQKLKLANKDNQQKQKQQTQQDFRLKSSSEIKPSRVFILNRERLNTYSMIEQQGKQESSIQNPQASQNSTQISATINKSSSKKNKIPNLNFNSTYYFSSNSNFNSSNNKKQNKFIKDSLSTPRNKTSSYFFKREETGTEDEDWQNSKTQRIETDFQIQNSIDGVCEYKNSVKSSKLSLHFLNSPKNNSLFFSNNKNTEQLNQKQLKTIINNIIPQTSSFQPNVKTPQSSNKSTTRNVINTLNAQSSFNNKIKLLNLRNLQTESSQQKYLTERIDINNSNNNQDSKIGSKNISQQEDQIRQKLIKQNFKLQSNQQFLAKNKIQSKKNCQNSEQLEQRNNINQNYSDGDIFSHINQLQNEKVLDVNIKQTRSQKKQQLIYLSQTEQNNILFQAEESKQNQQMIKLTPQQEEVHFLKNSQQTSSSSSNFSQQNNINLNEIQNNNCDQLKLSKDHENNNDDQNDCNMSNKKNDQNINSDDLSNQLIKTRNSKKSSLIDPSQLILLKKLMEKKQNQNLEQYNSQKTAILDRKQNEETLENLKLESNSPKSNNSKNEENQCSPTLRQRKSCINVDYDCNTRYLEQQNEDSEYLMALGLDYFGIKQLSHYCDFQTSIPKKSNPKIQQIIKSNTYIHNSFQRIDTNQYDFSQQQLNFDNSKRIEEQKKKINILELDGCTNFEDLTVKNSLILKKNKNTLDRKMQQYIKRTFLEFEKYDNIQDKNSQEIIPKQSQEAIDNKNQQNNQLDLQKLNIQNTLQRINNQQNSPNRSSKTQQQNGIIQLTVSINPPLNNTDNPSQTNNQQVYKFVTFKNEKVSSTSIYSETSHHSYISSETNEDSDNMNFDDTNNQQVGEESDKEDEISLQLIEDNTDNEFNTIKNGNNIKSNDLKQQNQKLNKMKDPKNSFTATRNYLMNYLQKQNSQIYFKKMSKLNKGIQNVQDKQKIQQKVSDSNSFDQSQAIENTPKKRGIISTSKSFNKLPLDKKQATKIFLEHQYSLDQSRMNPFYSSQQIYSPKSSQQKKSSTEFSGLDKNKNLKQKANKKKKSLSKQTLENFSIEEINSSSCSSSENSESNSSDSSNSSIDEDSLGNTQSQLGMDQYQQQFDQATFQQLQYVNDIEIYEDESYDPFTLSNSFIKSLQPLSLNESNSLLVRLYENIPPIISELQENQVEQVLNIKFQGQDQETIELLMKKNNIGDKYKQISEKLEQDEKRYFKQYYSNYFSENKDLLFGNFEDQNTINSNFYYLFSINNQPNKTKAQTSNNKIESNFLKAQNNNIGNHKKYIKQQKAFKEIPKVYKEQPEQSDSKEQKEENQNLFQMSDSINNYCQDAEFESDGVLLTKKLQEKKINLSQSLKESISLSNEYTLQIQRSKFSSISNKNQKETFYEDQHKKKSLTTAQQTPLAQSTKAKQQNQPTQEYNQDFTITFQTPPLNSVQAPNNIQQVQNVFKNINKIKGSQNQTNNKNYIQLNSSISQSRLQPDILDKQSLSISNRNHQISKRKLLPPELQIMMAIKHNSFTEFEDIFSKFHQIQINYSDEEGNSFLIIASSVGNIDIVKELIFKGIDINHQNDLGNTALHMALAYGNSEVADFLLQFKIDQNLVNINNQTAWDTAIYN
ncbi:hypothetical protein ABPG72_011630 [Tetrahymena utriculariae]